MPRGMFLLRWRLRRAVRHVSNTFDQKGKRTNHDVVELVPLPSALRDQSRRCKWTQYSAQAVEAMKETKQLICIG